MKLKEDEIRNHRIAESKRKSMKKRDKIVVHLASQKDNPSKEDVKIIYPSLSEIEVNRIFGKIKRKRKQLAKLLELSDVDGVHNKKVENYIYLIVNSSYNGWIKCGITSNVKKRVSQYNSHTPLCNYELIVSKLAKNNYKDERLLIYNLKQKAESVYGKEWFKIDKELALEIFNTI